MRFRLRRALATVLASLALGAATAHGYAVPTHEALTLRSIELLRRCRDAGALDTQIPDASTAHILQYYDAQQDHWLNKTGLWHFPYVPWTQRCPGPFPSCAMVIARSFELWTDDLWRRVRATLPPDQLYPALGAALHYVQDMAVPAHAVPVFHPAGLLHFADGVDNFADWEGPESRPSAAQLPDECAAIARASSLPQLLREIRSETLESLQQTFMAEENGQVVELPFRTFWRAGPEERSFGAYGCDADFGAPELTCAGHTYRVSPAVYRRFAAERARSAIRFGAATIALFQRMLAPCAAPGCAPREGDEAWLPTRSHVKALARQRTQSP